MVNFVILLTKQLLCNLINFISKFSSFLWLGCLQRAEWMEDRWGGKLWCTPECCSSDEAFMVAFTMNSPCLTGCAPGVRLGGSDWCLFLFLPLEEAPSLGSVRLPCPCPARGQCWGEGSLLGVLAQLWLQTLSVSQTLASHARAMMVEDV